MSRPYALIATTLAFSIGNAAFAQDSKLLSPQPEHKLLARFAGHWQFEKKSSPKPPFKKLITMGKYRK